MKLFNTSLQALVAKTAPAVVQVLATGYGPVESQEGKAAVIGRQQVRGSGVIVDPDGYIITNAHVIQGARRISVVLTLPNQDGDAHGAPARTDYAAVVLGVHRETDLALLKIDAGRLPFLPLNPQYAARQGELVIALGSPEGLRNSATMGIVSAVDRQPDPSQPMVFIQTDAPINRGNSGGPLVDVEGKLLGVNSMMLSSGGGSEGVGFAIPVRIVSFVYEQLRKVGHVDRSHIGATADTITPLLAEGLRLSVTKGVIVSDVEPGGPAEGAGLSIGDIVLSVDGRTITSLPQLDTSLYLHSTTEIMKVEVLRGKEPHTLQIPVVAQKHDVDQLLDLADPEKNLIGKLGVLGIDLDGKLLAKLPELRIKSGVIVVAKTTYGRVVDVGLLPGDVIHGVNNLPVVGLTELRLELSKAKTDSAVVLQVEREGKLGYLPFEVE